MKTNIALVVLGCAMAASYAAQAAPANARQVNLDAREGAEYFHFPAGTTLKVTELVCPANVTVSVTCRTADHGRCGRWYLPLNGTVTAAPKSDMGIASLDYSGPENCRATVTVTSP